MIDKRRHRHEKIYVPVCDCCGDELDPEWDYEDAVCAIRAAGWTSKKVGGDWGNYCRECSEETNSARSEFND